MVTGGVSMLGTEDAGSTVDAASAGRGSLGITGARPSSVCFRSGFALAAGTTSGVAAGAGGGSGAGEGSGSAGAVATGGSERGGTTGAIPSSVCLRSGFVAATSGVAVGGVERGTLIKGVALADGGVDAGTSGVAMADGRVEGAASGVLVADGRDDAGRGGEEARGTGVGMAAAGLDEGRGAGAGADARGGEDGVAAALSCGTRAGAGISSAPHSESISSVGGAMDGIGGRPLTRSLSDRLSVIAL